MTFELLEALKAAVFDFTALLRVEVGPLSVVELVEKIKNEVVVHEVHKRVSDIG